MSHLSCLIWVEGLPMQPPQNANPGGVREVLNASLAGRRAINASREAGRAVSARSGLRRRAGNARLVKQQQAENARQEGQRVENARGEVHPTLNPFPFPIIRFHPP